MQRDKRGRFVKKAKQGSPLLPPFSLNGNTTNYTLPSSEFDFNTSLNSGFDDYQSHLKSLEFFNLGNQSADPNSSKLHQPRKIKFSRTKDGRYISEYGNEISIFELGKNPDLYEGDFFGIGIQKSGIGTKAYPVIETEEEEDSNGMTVFDVEDPIKQAQKKQQNPIDKTKLANFLELTRAGIGASVNNKIADRALEAEKPFLQDVSESHRAIYGDYRAQVEGAKAAAQLRNLASKPITSDGALQQQMMMEAQIKGQQYIDQGNAQDEALIKQTRETAWQQEKENQQQRQAVAMSNKQAMLMSEKNRAQIKNMRDSANFSQVVSPLLAATEQRLRNEGVRQKYYQDYYDDATVVSDVWNNYRDGLTDSQKVLAQKYLTEGTTGISSYVTEDATKQKEREQEWLSLKRIMDNEVIKRKALIHGAVVNTSLNQPTVATTNLFDPYQTIFKKKGGTIYKAKLTKRTRDNDRGAKSIETSKKIAARFLEKAINSLYDYNDVEIIAKPGKKKRKYQAGGGLPFVNFTPVFATSESGAPKEVSKKSEDKDDLTTKDVLSLLKDMDGLPSDMQLIVTSLKNFELQDTMDPLGLSSSSDIASRYISLINKIKVAKFNREEYNQAFNQLKGNGGLNELAITSDGLVVGTNEDGDFKYFTPEQASKGIAQKEGYQLLTNSNLLYLRANSSDAAFNHRLITVASNGIGIATVNKYITDSLASLGTSENSEQGYVSSQQGELLQGLQDFAKAVQNAVGQFDGTVNDLYKYKYLTKTQAEQAKKAMQYIYQTLPENAKALLKIKSDGSDNGALKLVETLISSQLDTTKQFDLDLAGGKTHKSTSDDAKDMSDLETSLPLNILKNVGGVDSYLDIDRGDGIHMSVRGTQFNLIKTPSGEAILDTSISNMLHQSGLQSIIKDMRNIQFGDQKISPEVLSNITYNNTGITRAILPIKSDGSVNLELLEAYEKAETDIELSGDKSPENVKTIYEQYGISSLLNANGTYNQSKFAPFMVTEGYTTDALSGLKPSDFVMEYRGDENAAIALMQKCLAVGSGKNVQTPEIDSFSWYNPMDWFSWTDTIFKGVLYIPITNNVNTAVFGANQTLDYDEALLQEEKYQNFEKMSNQRSTGADLLNI